MNKLNLGLIGLMIAGAILLYPELPSILPVHWGINGQADGFLPKTYAVWLLPGLALLVFGLFKILPSLDPKRDKYAFFKREWQIMQIAIIAFFAYMEFVTFYLALNPTMQIQHFIFIGLGLLFILIGNFLAKVRQNYFIGVKLPWTLASEDNWNKTHRFAGWCFVVAGIITVIEGIVIWFAPGIIFASIILAALLPIIYSFLLFKNMVEKMKVVYLALGIIIFALIFIRLVSGEDNWVCQNGQWVKHGNPSTQMPLSTCP
ncbi:SdpI family protein [Patescibacteria group bacterium]|nr:SdpI family protein [Patescibacteria group bacterium]MCL5409739.1 SdpI family protein [Patescibacteria group bacterium]